MVNKFNEGVSTTIGIFAAIFAGVIGNVLSLSIDGIVFLIVLSYLFGISAIPRIIFEFAPPKIKIYMASGSLGIAFIKLTVSIFKANGAISTNEISKLKKYLEKEFGKEIAIAAEKYITSENQNKETIASICKPLTHLKPIQRSTIMYRLFFMSATDNIYSKEIEVVLRQIAKHLHIGKRRFYYIKSSVIKGEGFYDFGNQNKNNKSQKGYNFHKKLFSFSSNPYFILGVSINTSDLEIKKAYRDLVKKYHPDLAMKKSEQYQKSIKERVQEINNAYQTIKKIRNIK